MICKRSSEQRRYLAKGNLAAAPSVARLAKTPEFLRFRLHEFGFHVAVLAGACGGAQDSVTTTKTESPAIEHRSDVFESQPTADRDDRANDGLVVRGIRGRIETADIESSVATKSRNLNRCFTSVSRRQRFLNGAAEIAFVVDSAGQVKNASLQDSDIGSWQVEQCLVEVATSIVFPVPQGGVQAEFSVPLTFAGRVMTTTWDESVSLREVASLLPTIADCPEPPSSTRVTFYVGRRGAVVGSGYSGVVSQPWVDCVAGAMSKWHVADPKGRVAKASFHWPPASQTDQEITK